MSFCGCINDEDFNFEVDQFSPPMGDFDRKVKLDEEGNERISFEKVDYILFVQSRGTAEQYKLNTLIEAGIDPNFNIQTGSNSRIENIAQLNSIKSDVNTFFEGIGGSK